jgi:hypothetical protein
VISGNVPLDVEAVKQRLLRHRPLTHHRPISAHLREIESGHGDYFKPEFFNTIAPISVIELTQRHAQKRTVIHFAELRKS